MASLKLIDTGYLKVDRTGTPESGSNIANSGAAIDLTATAEVRMRWGSNIESEPEPGTNQSTNSQPVSFENKRFDVRLRLKKDNATDQEIIKDLVGVIDNSSYPGFLETKGVKALYISGTSDSKKTVVELLGSTATNFHSNEISAGLPAVLGFVENISIDESPDSNMLTVRFSFVEA